MEDPVVNLDSLENLLRGRLALAEASVARTRQELTAVALTRELLRDQAQGERPLATGAAIVPEQNVPIDTATPPSFPSLVERAITLSPQVFTIRDVLQNLPKETNQSSVSGFLRRKESEGELLLVERGSGRRPTRYGKPATVSELIGRYGFQPQTNTDEAKGPEAVD